MAKIPAADMVKIFRVMYQEHWAYVWGAAEYGCVDCSGAFCYAYSLYNKRIAHGSNSIAHKYVGTLLPISEARPGMAAFKVRAWAEDQKGNAWYGKEPGDVHHIGLVDEDTGYVLNAKGQKSGFCRDRLTTKNGWDYVAELSEVEYDGGGGGGMGTVVIKGGNVEKPINMRSSSTTESKIITEIPQGSTAELIREDGKWDKIKYGGMTGYVLAEFVNKSESPDPPQPTPTGDTVAVIRAELQAVYDKIGSWLGLRG